MGAIQDKRLRSSAADLLAILLGLSQADTAKAVESISESLVLVDSVVSAAKDVVDGDGDDQDLWELRAAVQKLEEFDGRR